MAHKLTKFCKYNECMQAVHVHIFLFFVWQFQQADWSFL